MSQPPQHSEPVRGRRSIRERRRGERRVLAIALVLSVVVHLLAIVVASDWLEPEPTATPTRPSPVVLEPPRGIRVVEMIDGQASAVPDRPQQPDSDTPDVPAPEPVPEPDDEGDEGPDDEPAAAAETELEVVAADDRTAADRLAPRAVDPRLWRPMILIPREPTFEDVQARVAAAVELLSDSALAEAEAAMNARDWTVEDDDGGRWGISPGQLHLGSLTLPLPNITFDGIDQQRAREPWLELDDQLERAMIMESFRERVRAIRERRERERAEENGGG